MEVFLLNMIVILNPTLAETPLQSGISKCDKLEVGKWMCQQDYPNNPAKTKRPELSWSVDMNQGGQI